MNPKNIQKILAWDVMNITFLGLQEQLPIVQLLLLRKHLVWGRQEIYAELYDNSLSCRGDLGIGGSGDDAVTYAVQFCIPWRQANYSKMLLSLLTSTIQSLPFPLLPARKMIPDTKKDKKKRNVSLSKYFWVIKYVGNKYDVVI